MKRGILILVGIITISISEAQNPFAEYGYNDVQLLTLSNGTYNEVFNNDSLVQIGSVILNTKTKRLAAFVEVDTIYDEASLEPDIISRWMSPDPLAEKFYEWSPYHFSMNNPILYIDPNGLAASPYYDESTGVFLGVDENGFAGDIKVTSQEAWNSADKDDNGNVNSKQIGENADTKSFDESDLADNVKGSILTHVVNYNLDDGNNIDADIKITITDENYNFSAKDATPSNIEIKASKWQNSYETTVENIRNTVNQHEVNAHVLKGIRGWDSEHYKAYQLQVDHKSFQTTTKKHQATVMSQYYVWGQRGGFDILGNSKYKSLFYNSGGYDKFMEQYK